MPKLIGVSAFVEALGVVAMLLIDWDYDWLFLLVGFIYFFIMYSRYRNKDARAQYEYDTKREIDNVKKDDSLIERKTGLSSSRISGENSTMIDSSNVQMEMVKQITDQTPVGTLIDDVNKHIKNNDK